VDNRFLYTGREWIAQAQLYDYRNRVYSPVIGRFMQIDPIRFNAGDVNMYRYVGNGVTRYIDPTGLDAFPASGGGYNFGIRTGLDPANFIGSRIRNPNPRLDGQCATGAQYLAGTSINGRVHDAPRTRTWRPGEAVGPNTRPGTMIATGWVDGRYPNDPNGPNHTAIFLSTNPDGTINVLDQAAGMTLEFRSYSADGWHSVVSDFRHDSSPTTSVPTAVPAN
jgi:RHS repeat-associated protein